MEGWMKGAVNGEGLLICHVLWSLQTFSHLSLLPNLWNLSSKDGHLKRALWIMLRSHARVPFICNFQPISDPRPRP